MAIRVGKNKKRMVFSGQACWVGARWWARVFPGNALCGPSGFDQVTRVARPRVGSRDWRKRSYSKKICSHLEIRVAWNCRMTTWTVAWLTQIPPVDLDNFYPWGLSSTAHSKANHPVFILFHLIQMAILAQNIRWANIAI